jgi:hypothetical protein
MRPGETRIEMTARHLLQADEHVREQRALLQHLVNASLPSEDAAKLLHMFEQMLTTCRGEVHQLTADQHLGLRDADGNRIFRRP